MGRFLIPIRPKNGSQDLSLRKSARLVNKTPKEAEKLRLSEAI